MLLFSRQTAAPTGWSPCFESTTTLLGMSTRVATRWGLTKPECDRAGHCPTSGCLINFLSVCLVQRPGAFAVYLEPWHADVFDFLELKKNTGKEEQRARDLFFALWIPDLFMKRVESNQVNAGGKAGRRTSHFIINSSEANELSFLPDIFNCKV